MATGSDADRGAGNRSSTSPTARSVVVHGRVQGVFFRDSCRQEATRLGVAGWVRNEPDGSVRVHAEGDPEAVAALVQWLHEGPRFARVRRVDVTVAGPTGATSFDVR